VTVSDIYVFGASSSARELAITHLDDFMRGKAAASSAAAAAVGGAAAAEGGAGAGAGAGAANAAAPSPAPGSDVAAGGSPPREPLPALVAPTEAVNSVKLSVPGGASAAGETYGAKIATLLRRLKRMPPGDKAVVATSWPRLRPVIASALRAEGIDAVVLEGTPAQMSASVAQFTAKGDPHRIKVMLLAVGTDCSGLTLTVANHLFIVVRADAGAKGRGEAGVDVAAGGCLRSLTFLSTSVFTVPLPLALRFAGPDPVAGHDGAAHRPHRAPGPGEAARQLQREVPSLRAA
jgi:hypothetical protein